MAAASSSLAARASRVGAAASARGVARRRATKTRRVDASTSRRRGGGARPRALASDADADEILGVYVTASAEDIRAAPVRASDGTFLRAGASTKLEAATASGVAAAVKRLVEQMEWTGAIGISLPGLVTRVEGERGDGARGTMARTDIERAVKQATGCETSISSGAEACGAAELAYGAGVELSGGEAKGLVMFCMIGGRFSTSLYDGGKVVKNFAGEKLSDGDGDVSGISTLPDIGGANDTDEAWAAFGERVREYLSELERKYKPDVIILGGKAGQNADKIMDKLTALNTKVVPGTLGFVAGVKGAALLAKQQIGLRETLAQVREAVGVQTGVSPQFVSDEQLKSVFDTFDTSKNGVLELNELVDATLALNVKVNDVQSLMDSLDLDANGVVTFDEWCRWWKSEVSTEAVTTIVSQDEWRRVLKMESKRLICLEVGFTFCRPCKAFARKYHQIAEQFPSVKFVYMNGNENGSTTILARDDLGVKSTPSFFLFRAGEKLHFHSGAKEERLRNAINRHMRDGEWPALAGPRPPVISEDEELRAAAAAEAT